MNRVGNKPLVASSGSSGDVTVNFPQSCGLRQEMIVHCARFLKEPEVTNLLDAVNATLGQGMRGRSNARQ